MTSIEIAALGVVCTLLGLVISYAAFLRNSKKDSGEEGREAGTVLTELGYIKSGIDDLKTESREQRKINTDLITRVTAVEASAKQAHKRLDAMEGKASREETVKK